MKDIKQASSRPDIRVIETALRNSYQVSGPESARVILMTATPDSESDPCQLIKLLNLLRPDPIPDTIARFNERYYPENGGMETPMFIDDIAGYISYLNMELDRGSFAAPVKHTPIYADLVDCPATKPQDCLKAKLRARILEDTGKRATAARRPRP